MIKCKALRVQHHFYIERWVEFDGSSRGKNKRTGKSYGQNHHCYRGVIRCDGKRQYNFMVLPPGTMCGILTGILVRARH